MNIRKLPQQESRVESGPLQFGDDWPGVFIRGDNAFGFRLTIESVLNDNKLDPLLRSSLRGLLEVLDSCNLNEDLRIKPIECKIEHKRNFYSESFLKSVDYGCYSPSIFKHDTVEGVYGAWVHEGCCPNHGVLTSPLGGMWLKDRAVEHPCPAMRAYNEQLTDTTKLTENPAP